MSAFDISTVGILTPLGQPKGVKYRLLQWMKRYFLAASLMALASSGFAQKVDSIYFNLYTDSLKKGQHNYINVDGKLSNGKWLPLTEKEISFSCSTATFEGNQLIIPENFRDKSVTVKAVLKTDPTVFLERTIWIKQAPDPVLPTSKEVMEKGRKRN